jgi:hypothetical protein
MKFIVSYLIFGKIFIKNYWNQVLSIQILLMKNKRPKLIAIAIEGVLIIQMCLESEKFRNFMARKDK